MKNTIRVHRNGDTQTDSAQTKISRRKAKLPARFAIHQSSTAVPVQVLVADQSPAETRLLIPSQVSQDTEAALLEMERVGNAAVAFVMMNANLIANISNDDDGCKALNAPGFSKGALELARLASRDFQATFGDLSIVAHKMMEKIKGMHGPVKKENHSNYSAVVAIDPKGSWYRIESVCGALKHCIDLQSWTLCCYKDGTPQSGCFEMQKNLEAADEAIERTTMDLLNIFCVATAFEKGGTR